jgi:hypothetical protein
LLGSGAHRRNEDATGTKDATDLAHGRGRVGDGAQRPGRQGPIDGVILELQRLAVQTNQIDLDVRGCETLSGEVTPSLQRVDCQQPADGRRKVRTVEPSAESDLQHLAGERLTYLGADPARLFRVARRVRQSWEYAIAEAHGR